MDVDHIATTSGLAQSKSENTMSTALRSHLYSSGLLQGACADIRLRAFGRIYNLHRLFLIQAGFFRAMLCGGFAEGLAAAGSARRGRHGVREEEEGDVLDLHFDDPNMTRAAFEFCIAKLYGGGPVLVLPTWSLPLPSHPLSSVFPSADGFASMSGEQVWSGNQQPATPRFLLSLLATSIYLNIPSITSQALTLILCSVTPYTVTHYLRFAIGKGICGAVEAMRRSPPRNGRGAPEQQGFEWDWEMEGPARGLEDLGQLDESVSKAQGVAATDGYDAPMRNSAGAQETEDDDTIEAKTKSLSISSESASAQKSTDANTRSSSMDKGDSSPATPGGKTSAPKSSFLSPDSTPDLDGASTRTGDSTFAPRSHAEPMRPTEFFYGAPGEKIGEACACWLVRWGGDILDAEEAADRHRMKSVENSLADVSESFSSHSSPSAALLELAMYLCPVGTLPDSVPMPPLALWSYEQMPSAWVRAVISCDSFFVRTEWDRYVFAKRVVEMRRAQKARAEMEAEERTGYGPRRDSVDTSLSDAEDQEMDDESSTPHASFGFGLQSYGAREERMERQSAGKDRRSSLKCKARARESVSSAADVSSAFLSEDEDEREYEELFSSGIYYTHMSFQELNKISTDVSPSTGRPYAPLSVLQSALWAGSELRNHILSSTNPINALSLGHIGFPGAQTFGSLSGARAGGADETSAETGENANAQTDLGVSSALTDFEEAYDRSRTSRANSPASFAFAPQQTLGGLGASPLMMGSAGGSALLAKRYFPVPADDTVRLGDGLTQVSTSTSPPPADGRPSSPGAGESSATGVAAARDPSTVAVANPGANGHLGSGNGGAGGGVKRDRHNFFGICNITRTGGQLAESGGADDTSAPGSERWTGYEPMRVGVEFYGVDKLAEKQRLYSPTFFYAGSIWNLYVQTIKKPKGLQLGVYLHRQSPLEPLPPASAPPPPPIPTSTADPSESLGHPLMRATTTGNATSPGASAGASVGVSTPQRGRSRALSAGLSHSAVFYPSSPSTPVGTTTTTGTGTAIGTGASFLFTGAGSSSAVATTTPLRAGAVGGGGGGNPGSPTTSPVGSPTGTHFAPSAMLGGSVAAGGGANSSNANAHASSVPSAAPLVPYRDPRKVLRAYFSIHCPSPLGNALTRFSSGPDHFTVSQSWGWKSSSLSSFPNLGVGAGAGASAGMDGLKEGKKESDKFRCTVVLGLV